MDAYKSGSTSPGAKYRGAVVEDLQLPPAFCLPATAPLSAALEAAYEREFDQLPVLNERRRPIGYLNVKAIKEKFEKGQASQNDPLEKHTTHFRPAPKSPTHPYTVIHPLSPLEDLEAFLVKEEFALVTDQERKWVLAVATRGDLETFVKRRG